jgi:putative DNA primase/helicase
MTPIDFHAINQAALPVLPTLLHDWLPNGRYEGHEYVALNPTRQDRNLGSFKINTRTGRWADFATGDKGGDLISLLAYLEGCSQSAAANRLSAILDPGDGTKS